MRINWKLGFAVLFLSGVSVMAAVKPSQLRCEYLTDPLAIETPNPRLSWTIESDQRAVRQVAYQVLVATDAALLGQDKGDLWDSGKVASDATAQLVYAGEIPSAGQMAYWKVGIWCNEDEKPVWSEVASWRMGMLAAADWKAKWIGLPREIPDNQPLPALPVTMLRKEFSLAKPLKRAILTASALGMYELRLNGQRVSEDLFAPNWTDYHQRVQYQAYDVTDLLKGEANALGALLGDGWYAGRIGISHIDNEGPLRGFYGRRTWLLAQLEIEYADGGRETIATDGSWKATLDGPIVKACILDGEVYDARKEMPGWDKAKFDDSQWKPVETQDSTQGKLVAQPNEPIRVTQELKAVAMTEPKPGVYVFDIGQNIAGYCRLKVNAPAGTTVTLRHAEVLEKDGNIYRTNLRIGGEVYGKDVKLAKFLGARAEDQYTTRTDGEEIFVPHFTYHGFRYVEVTGLPSKPTLDAITGLAFHSAPPMTGEFSCSSELLNKLMSNIVWTLRDNLPSVPTDCPQRDERMGWMGDMLAFAQPACFLMDMGAFFTKWQRDICDDQTADGRFPDFAPHPFGPDKRFSGVPAWGDAGVVVPWRMYVNYGDKAILAEHFDSMKRWVDYIHKANPDLLWKNGRNNDYGDWLNGDTLELKGFGFPQGGAEVPKEAFATAFFQQSASMVAKMAAVIGRSDDAATYTKLADEIREAFNKAYVKEDGQVANNSQAAYALALNLNLLSEDKRPAAAKRMVEAIAAYKNHISTGFHTTVMLMNELSRWGYSDEAYKLINNRTIPSWGYTIDQGGTTIWERWDGYVEGRGFQNPGMNSFCHYAIGSVGEWMYRSILGINPDEQHPGYAHIILQPRIGGGLTWARGHYDSIRGRIGSEWKLEGDKLTWTVTVPANTTATAYVPATDAAQVTESGQPTAKAQGVKFLRTEPAAAVYELGSGTYVFQTVCP